MDSNVAPRVPLKLEVEYRKSYARQADAGTLRNISLTGAFLEAPDAQLYKQDKVTLVFSVSGRTRRINAQVVWTSSHGAGIVFHHFNNRDLQIIDDLIYFTEASREKRRNVFDTIIKKVA